MNVKKYILILICLVTQTLVAQVTFEAKVSKKKLGINERLKIEFVMNQDGDNFTPPNFAGFNVVSGPSQSINRSWINGKSSFSKTYTYTLAPTRKGTLTIKNASIEVNGEIYKTIPIRIQVTNAVDKPLSNAEYEATENIHLVAEVSNTNPYYNEGITVTYKLYFKDINIGLRDLNLPKFNDFWSQEIKLGNAQARRGEFKGQTYDYVVLKKTILYPQKTGKLYIEPMSAEVAANIPTSKFNLFGRVYEKVNLPVTSARRTITVKPLPENKPATFTGAVGKFEFDVLVNKNSLKAGEALEARVEVRGTGNLKLLDLPALSTPSALEVYDPERSEDVSVTGTGMKGKVSNTYVIVPNYKGKYPIPSIRFTYFDLETESYKTVRSIEQVIDVFDGPTNSNSANNNVENTTNNTKQEVVGKNQFRFITTSSKFTKMNTAQFFRSTLFWSLLFIPFAILPIFLLVTKRRKKIANDIAGNKTRTADKLARKYLSTAKKNLSNKDAFYESLHKSLHNYLKAKFAIETSEFSKDHIKELLHQKGVSSDIITSFIELISSCELARFTPASNDTMQQDYEKAAKVINAIDKQIS